MTEAVEFHVLGPLEVTVGGGPVRIGSQTQRTLLALLLMHPNELVSSDQIVDALWPDSPADGRRKLWFHVSKLRGILQRGSEAADGEVLVRRPTGYILRVDADRLDAVRFERLVNSARSVRHDDLAHAAELLREALGLWRGEPFEDVLHDDAVSPEAARLNEVRLTALEDRLEAELALGGGGELVPELEALVAAHPFREHFRAQLMLALYRAGRQADALTAFADARRTLVDELGIEPGEELSELQRQILVHDSALGCARRRETPPATQPTQAGAPVTTKSPSRREELKVVTALFVTLAEVDVSMERRDPEEIRAFLTPYHDRIRAELARFGGTVEKFIGDEVMALFGAAVAHEDDPERAVRAALAIGDWLEESGPPQARIGIETGEADVRLGESASVAVGEVVNKAVRLRAAAPVNGVLVGERTHRATRHAIEYHEAEPLFTDGKSEPLQAWQAVRALAEPGVDLTRHRSPFIGRQRELGALHDRLTWAISERSPQLVTILGVPGIGKTRLLSELRKAAAKAGDAVRWCGGRSLPYGDGISFWALGEMVKREALILESDPAETALRKLAEAVERIVDGPAEAQEITRSLSVLLGLRVDESAGDTRADRFAAWRDFIEALADERPSVLVFEDLHWADDGLLDFVDELLDRVSGVPLLVVATARPELLQRRPGWAGGKANAVTISLPPLSDRETALLVAALLEQSIAEADAQEALIARVGGIPLYAEQFCRMLLERRGLDELPETVHGIIAARLDALAPEQKGLLQDAAVVGRVFWTGALEAIGGLPRDRVEEELYALERHEFVNRARRSSVAGNIEYAFRHDLLRDVAYGAMPRAARGERHRLAAEWIESLARPEDHAELLAHHYLSALEYGRAAGRDVTAFVERAVQALHRAGARAVGLSANDRAAEHFSKAVDLVRQLPQDEARNRTEAELHLQLGVALFALRGFGAPEVEQALARAADLTIVTAPATEQFPLYFSLCLLHLNRGNFDRTEPLIEHMTALAAEGDDSLRLQSLHARWMAASVSGRIDAVIGAADEGLAIYRPDNHHQLSFRYGNHDPAVCALTLQALAFALRGDSKRAVGQMRDAITLSETLGHPTSRAQPLSWLPVVLHINGDIDATLREADHALAAAGEVPHPMMFGLARAMRGWALSCRRYEKEGLAELERALDDLRRDLNNVFAATIGVVLAEAQLRHGRREAVRHTLDDLRELSRSMTPHFFEAERLRVEAAFLRREGDESEARQRLQQAVATAHQQGAWALAVRAAVDLAKAPSPDHEADLQLLASVWERLPTENDATYGREARALLGSSVSTPLA